MVDSQLFLYNMALERLTICLMRTASFMYTPEQALDRLLHVVDEHEFDVLVAPEFYFFKGYNFFCKECNRDSVMSKGRKDDIIGRIVECLGSSSPLVIPGTVVWQDNERYFNTAPIIFNGKVIEYDKHQSESILLAKQTGLHAECRNQSGIFKWQGYNVGIEVCSDHYNGILKKQGCKVDMHVIISYSHIGNKRENSCARDSGLIVVCNGFSNGHTEVRKQSWLWTSSIKKEIVKFPKFR